MSIEMSNSLAERSQHGSFLMRLFASRSARRAGSQDEGADETPSEQPANRQKKILVVDDDAIILKTISLKLKSRGYSVVTAMDGPGAISTVRKENPDLILLDISLPANMGAVAWDGLLVMSWLRRLEEARNIPIIVITGCDPMEYKSRSLAAGAMAFFHKPIDHGDLLSVIERSVSRNAESREVGYDTTFQI